MAKIKQLPLFRLVCLSIVKELGYSLNTHATITNLSKHLEKNQRYLAKPVIKAFVKKGLLRKHRTNTFSLTVDGREYLKRVLSHPLKIICFNIFLINPKEIAGIYVGVVDFLFPLTK